MLDPDIEVEPFEGEGVSWDSALESLRGSSFCHQYGWRRVMQDALGHEAFYWIARGSHGEALGLLPTIRVRSRLFGDYLVSMPFLNYGGPVGSPNACVALSQAAVEQARSLDVDLLELRTRNPILDTPLTENTRKLTVVKSLPQTSEELWENGIKAKLRSQIRRPMKEGMEIHFGRDRVSGFYEVFSRTMRDLGTPVLPKSFFDIVGKEFSDTVLFAVVELGGQPVAAGCGLLWQGEFEISWAGSSREHAKKAPNMLLYWGMMVECIRREAHTFNFGRCSPDSGTHRFKRQWGSRDQPLPWLQWSPSGVLSTPNPDSRKFRAATNLWSRLPMSITNVIGPRVSRLIP